MPSKITVRNDLRHNFAKHEMKALSGATVNSVLKIFTMFFLNPATSRYVESIPHKNVIFSRMLSLYLLKSLVKIRGSFSRFGKLKSYKKIVKAKKMNDLIR